MKIDLDKHQILYYLEGCAYGSHLRQGCWHDMIALYPKMDQGTRDFLYTYAKRDIAPVFERVSSDGFRPCGAEDFEQFLACFDKDNRYMVTAEKDNEVVAERKTSEAYYYNGRYYVNATFFFDDEFITDVKKIENGQDEQ